MQVEHNADVLYDRCLRDPVGTVFYQQDLMAFNIVTGVEDLQALCEQLVQAQRLRIFTDGGQICWKGRRRMDADKLVKLLTDDRMVYNHIETAGTAGMWSKSLRAKTNLHQTVVNKCLKTLESQGLIREIKSAKFPARKIYMLRYLTPSEETTGGVFFTDGEMDMALIDALGEVILRFVQDQSWDEQTTIAEDTPMSAFSTSSKKRSRFDMEMDNEEDDEEAKPVNEVGKVGGIFVPPRNPRTNMILVPKRPQSGYPTTRDIHQAIINSQILNEGLELSEGNIQQLLDSLVYDNRLEKMKLPTKIVNGRSSGRARSPSSRMNMDDVEEFGRPSGSRFNGDTAASSSVGYTHGYRTTRPILYRPPPHTLVGQENKVNGNLKRGQNQADIQHHKLPIFYIPSIINGLSSSPCCRCPVFNLCEPGGPVSPANCEYFSRWIGTEGEWVPGVEDYATSALAAQAGGGASGDEEEGGGGDKALKVDATQPYEGVGTVGDGFAVALSTDGRRRAWYHG